MKDCLVEARTEYGDAVKTYLRGLTDEQGARLRQLGWDYPEGDRERIYNLQFIGMLSEIGTTKEEFEEIGGITISKVRGLNYDESFVRAIAHNAKVEPAVSPIQISVYNEALLSIKSIDWMEDACTQAIQSALNDDWKILAICPANDSRRPTYIMGHRDTGKKL
jgi:hypothetical protein